MPVVAPTTSLPCAGRKTGDNNPATLCEEVTRTPREVQAGIEDTISVGLQADSHAATAAQAIAPPTALSIVHHPISLTNHIASKPPIGTPRIVLTSYSLTALKPQPCPKVSYTQRVCLDYQVSFYMDSSFPPTMELSW